MVGWIGSELRERTMGPSRGVCVGEGRNVGVDVDIDPDVEAGAGAGVVERRGREDVLLDKVLLFLLYDVIG